MSSKDYFDQVAAQWDQMRAGFFPEAVREKALPVAGVQRGEIAADIGAGSGFITEGLVRRGLQVIAVDQSSANLETGRQARHHGPGRAHVRVLAGRTARPLDGFPAEARSAVVCGSGTGKRDRGLRRRDVLRAIRLWRRGCQCQHFRGFRPEINEPRRNRDEYCDRRENQGECTGDVW